MKVAIVGSTGYGGVELIRLIEQHPAFELEVLISTSRSGEPLSSSYPHLSHMDVQFTELNIEKWIENIEIIFFATPPGVSSRWVPQLIENNKIVIDLSGDYRLDDPQIYEKWYHLPPASKLEDRKAIYGLSEWFKDDISTATLIANPGCYPTATLLALLPLLKHQVVKPNSIIIDAKSGVTGAGRSVRESLLFCEINDNLRPYKLENHPHIPEIERFASFVAKESINVHFVPHLIPMSRGILVTMYFENMNNYTNKDLSEIYREVYQNASFIRIREQEWPQTKNVQASNYCDIGFYIDDRTGRITVLSVIDNLMKGAAGQAIQNANIRMGLPEETGLTFLPIFP